MRRLSLIFNYDLFRAKKGRYGLMRIKTLRKMAYGFRDMEFLELEIKAPHETKYALVG